MFWKKDIQEFFNLTETPEFALLKEAVDWEGDWRFRALRGLTTDFTKQWFSELIELMPDTHRVSVPHFLEDIGSELKVKNLSSDLQWAMRHGTLYFKDKIKEVEDHLKLLKVYNENKEKAVELEKPFYNLHKSFGHHGDFVNEVLSYSDFCRRYAPCKVDGIKHAVTGRRLAYRHYKEQQKEEPKFKAGSVVYFKSNPLVYRTKRNYDVHDFLNESVRNQTGIGRYADLRNQDELNKPVIVLEVPDIPAIDDSKGSRLYKVLPEGATRPYLMPERCFKGSPTKRRKKKSNN
jgi:hypothetical protein